MNVKISQLPTWTGTSADPRWFVMNNQGETTTYKYSGYTSGLLNGTGTDSIQSASFLTNLGTTASTQSAIAIGDGAEATSQYSIAIGYRAYNTNRDGNREGYITIGHQAQSVQYGVSVGYNSSVLGADAISIGTAAVTAGNGAVSIGKNSHSYSTAGVAIGNAAGESSNNFGIVIGTSNNNNDYGVSIGYGNTNNHNDSVVIGKNITSEYTATTHTTSLNVSKILSVDTVTASGVSGAVDFDLSQGSQFQTTLSGNSSVNFINWREGQILSWWVYNDGTNTISAMTISGGGSVYCQGGSLPNPTNNGYSYYTGTIYNGNLILLEHLNFQAV